MTTYKVVNDSTAYSIICNKINPLVFDIMDLCHADDAQNTQCQFKLMEFNGLPYAGLIYMPVFYSSHREFHFGTKGLHNKCSFN